MVARRTQARTVCLSNRPSRTCAAGTWPPGPPRSPPRWCRCWSVTIQTIDSSGNFYAVAHFGAGDFTPEAGVSYPVGSQEYISLRFTMSTTSPATVGPVFTGYQLKALPSIKRQRLITYPLLCYDSETDRNGNKGGYPGHAWDRINALESKENVGDSVRVTDFRTGESYIGIIEDMKFEGKTAVGKTSSSYGGTMEVTIRKF